MTCKDYLLKYLQSNPGWHRKGVLYNVMDESGYSPENGGRKLRELAEEGKIKVDYYKGKSGQKLAKYTADDIPVLVKKPKYIFNQITRTMIELK